MGLAFNGPLDLNNFVILGQKSVHFCSWFMLLGGHKFQPFLAAAV
jgi:hypothetical protein